MPFVARDLFSSTTARLDLLIHANDRSARRELCNIALFRPTFSAFDFPYVRLNTCSLALSYVASTSYLFIAVDMQCRETYT